MLKEDDENEMVLALREFCVLEKELESSKISLAKKQDFNLIDAFNIFDSARVGEISAYDIREGLNSIDVHPTQEEVELFVGRYDRTFDHRLNFAEFSDAFLP